MAAPQALLPDRPLAGSRVALQRGAEMTSSLWLRFCGVFRLCQRNGSHTVNHLGCDHFGWPGTRTVLGSVTFQNDVFENPQSCTYV